MSTLSIECNNECVYKYTAIEKNLITKVQTVLERMGKDSKFFTTAQTPKLSRFDREGESNSDL